MKSKKSKLDETMDNVLVEMEAYSAADEVYGKMMQHLKDLNELKKTKSSRGVSPDTVAVVAGNLAGILIIVGYERAHVVASKALSFAGKLR